MNTQAINLTLNFDFLIQEAKKSLFNLYYHKGLFTLKIYKMLLELLISYEKVSFLLDFYSKFEKIFYLFGGIKAFEDSIFKLKLLLASIFIYDGREVLI